MQCRNHSDWWVSKQLQSHVMIIFIKTNALEYCRNPSDCIVGAFPIRLCWNFIFEVLDIYMTRKCDGFSSELNYWFYNKASKLGYFDQSRVFDFVRFMIFSCDSSSIGSNVGRSVRRSSISNFSKKNTGAGDTFLRIQNLLI